MAGFAALMFGQSILSGGFPSFAKQCVHRCTSSDLSLGEQVTAAMHYMCTLALSFLRLHLFIDSTYKTTLVDLMLPGVIQPVDGLTPWEKGDIRSVSLENSK